MLVCHKFCQNVVFDYFRRDFDVTKAAKRPWGTERSIGRKNYENDNRQEILI